MKAPAAAHADREGKASGGGSPATFSIRRGLIWTVALGVILTPGVAFTGVKGLSDVTAAHAESSRALEALRYERNAVMSITAIRGDVLEAALAGAAADGASPELTVVDHIQAGQRRHSAQLNSDLTQLDRMVRLVPGGVPRGVAGLEASSRAYSAQATAVAHVALLDPKAAAAAMTALDRSFRNLEPAQDSLSATLSSMAARADERAARQSPVAQRWTLLLAVSKLVVLLGMAYFLFRLVVANTQLVKGLRASRAELTVINEHFEAGQRVAQVGSWSWERTTERTRHSAELHRIMGLSPEAPESPPAPRGSGPELFDRLVHPDDAARVKAERGLAQESGDFTSDYRIVRSDGSVRDVQGRSVAVRDNVCELVRVVGTLQDVTAQRAEQRRKDQFVSVISHELRTPLTSIRGALGLLAGGAVGPLSDKAQRMADVAVSSSDRLVRLINDILDVEKMAAGQLHLDLAPQRAGDLIAAAVHEMRPMAELAGVVLTSARAEGVVLADKDRVSQTLTNLLSNAVKFSAPGGVVTVAAQAHDGCVNFTVSDQGRGIPFTAVESIFERFQQVDASDSRERKGTGLGLPICRGIVEQHGGRIWVTSRVGRGSTFEFTLPTVLAGAGARTGDDVGAGSGTGGETADGNDLARTASIGTVLICDDDPEVSEVLATMLETHGFATLRADSGEMALDLARRRSPSVILMDLLLPGMSGWQTIAELNAHPSTADIPVVILSALSPDQSRDGTTPFWLTKPVDMTDLLQSLRRAVGADASARAVIVGDDPELGERLKAFFVDQGVDTHMAHTDTAAHTVTSVTSEAPPDLVVLDLGRSDANGFAVVEALRRDERLRSVPLVVYAGPDPSEAERSGVPMGGNRLAADAQASPDAFEGQIIGLLRSILGQTPPGPR